MLRAMTDTFNVAVIGGGATGYAAALAAGVAGLSTLHLAPPASIPAARTAALLDGSLALLKELGAWPRLAPHAEPLTAIRIVDASRRLLRAPEVLFCAEELGLAAFGANIANAAIVEALAACTAERDAILTIPAAAEAFETHADGVIIAAGDRRWKARLVVAADGARSMARAATGIGARRWTYPQSALVALLSVSVPHHGVSTEFHTEAGPLTLVPAPGGRMSLVWVDRSARAEAIAAMPDADFARAVEIRTGSLHGAMRVAGARAVFPLRAALADRFADRRTVLVGEAAHVLPPIGAQGLNLGFRDVAALRRVLARHRDDPGGAPALSEYHAARRADIRLRTLAIDLFNRSLLSDFVPVHILRGTGLALSGAVPALRRTLMRAGLAGSPSFREHAELGTQL
jgi:2-octaprenyl-6-methoxyphenol hydroxylase